MLFRRFAAALALLIAALTSQLPEFTQQYRQRLGGAIDELVAEIARFDADAAKQSLNRAQGIARLKQNGDPLAQERGEAMVDTVARVDRLEQQRDAFQTAGPISQYAVLVADFDPQIARHAMGDFQPALPVTMAGLIAAALGFLGGLGITHAVARPFRRRRPVADERHPAYR